MQDKNQTSKGSQNIQAKFYLKRDNPTENQFCLEVDLTFASSGVTAIYGASGSGKTTLLRCIAGLEKASQGLFSIGSEVWQDETRFVEPHKRAVGYVFQEASLFPHLNALQNLNYAIKRATKPLSIDEYKKILTIMDLQHLLQSFPHQLSGGEQQRVAIARALLTQPKILLMDEPLSALDAGRKSEIMPYLEKLTQNLERPIPILYVTHSLEEVSRLADEIILIQAGKIIKQGSLEAILPTLSSGDTSPSDNLGVVFKCQVMEQEKEWHLNKVSFDEQELWLHDKALQRGDRLRVRILAKDVSLALSNHQDSSILNRLSCEIVEIKSDQDDAYALVKLKLKEAYLLAQITKKSVATLKLEVGMQVWAQIKSVAIID